MATLRTSVNANCVLALTRSTETRVPAFAAYIVALTCFHGHCSTCTAGLYERLPAGGSARTARRTGVELRRRMVKRHCLQRCAWTWDCERTHALPTYSPLSRCYTRAPQGYASLYRLDDIVSAS